VTGAKYEAANNAVFPSLRLVHSRHVIHHGTQFKGHVLPSRLEAKFHAYAKQWIKVMGSVHHTLM